MSAPFDEIKNAIGTDPSYAWGWQCNLAISILDGSKGKLTRPEANEIAAHQMRHLFQYDVTVLPEYQDLITKS